MNKIFISGHKGLLGNSIVNEFNKDNNYKVYTISKKKLNLINYNKVFNFLNKKNIDIVINAAGLVGGIKKNYENQIDFLDTNYLIQSNLIKAAYNNNVKKYINIASSCIYPTNSKQPLQEEYLMNGKLEPTNEGYALSKICGVKLSEFYKSKFNFETKSLIPCNIYGTNDKYLDDSSHFISGIISRIYIAKKNNENIVKLWGTGKPKRELLINIDVARAIKFCLEKRIKEQNINIGSGIDFTIKQYAEKIRKLLDYKGKILWDNKYPDGMKRKLLDISILNKYKFKTKYNIDTGLKLIVDDFLKNNY